MNRVMLFAIIACLFGLLSCDDSPDVKAKLLAIESSLDDNPLLALAMLDGIRVEDLCAKEDKSLYSLLYIQALDKCYKPLPLPSDSMINIALEYFRDSEDTERYARLMFYLGRCYRDAGSIRVAMQIFKNAEQIAQHPNDLALINFELGELYKKQYTFDRAIERYKTAVSFFRKAGNIRNVGLTYSTISFTYLLAENQDSSLHYSQMSNMIAMERKDTAGIIGSLVAINGVQANLSGDYVSAKTDFHQIVNHYKPEEIQQRHLGHLLTLYYNCGDLDSARHVALSMKNDSAVSAASLALYMSKIEQSATNYRVALEYHIQYADLLDSLWQSKFDSYAVQVEKQYDTERLNRINGELKSSKIIWILTSASLVILLILISIIYRNRTLRKDQEVINAKRFISDLNSKINELSTHTTETDNQRMIQGGNVIRSLIKLSYDFQGDKAKFHKKFLEIMSVKANQNEISKFITHSLSAHQPDLSDSIRTKYPTLNEDEVIFMALVLSDVGYEELSVLYQIEYKSVIVKWSRLRHKIGAPKDKDLIMSSLSC